jgi:peptidoglycan hydrolase-like protein with peptidoglycan-binding domain
MAATIKKGATGADVTTLQQLLNGLGFSVAVTGTFDQATHDAVVAFQKAKGLTADGIVGAKTWAALTGKEPAHSYPAFYAKHASFGRQVLKNVWQEVTGFEPNLAELQIAGAQAHLESVYGHAEYKLLDHSNGAVLDTSGPINNWGAVQTSKGPPEGFLATDTSPLKKTADNPKGYYDHHYKVYPTPEAGARHFVEHMTVKRPTGWDLMKKGDIDAWAEAMHAGYTSDGKLKKDPISGTPGYFEQSPSARAKGIEERVWAIADTLGEPVAAKRGGPVDPGVALGQTPTDDAEEWGGGWTGKKAAGPIVVAGGIAGLIYTIARYGWPWTWRL